MAKAGYNVVTGAAIALVGATPKSILGVIGTADCGIDILGVSIEFDGVTATNVPALVELMYATFATNAPATNSTARTPIQVYGRAAAPWANAAASNWTAEPTVLTTVEEHLIPPTSGIIYQLPLAQTYDSAYSQGFVVRVTAPNAVNARCTIRYERS